VVWKTVNEQFNVLESQSGKAAMKTNPQPENQLPTPTSSHTNQRWENAASARPRISQPAHAQEKEGNTRSLSAGLRYLFQ
jgi:hypothetical protein